MAQFDTRFSKDPKRLSKKMDRGDTEGMGSQSE